MKIKSLFRIYVRSNQCDSHVVEKFMDTLLNAESYFMDRFSDAEIFRDERGHLCAIVRRGDAWWEYELA